MKFFISNYFYPIVVCTPVHLIAKNMVYIYNSENIKLTSKLTEYLFNLILVHHLLTMMFECIVVETVLTQCHVCITSSAFYLNIISLSRQYFILCLLINFKHMFFIDCKILFTHCNLSKQGCCNFPLSYLVNSFSEDVYVFLSSKKILFFLKKKIFSLQKKYFK